MKRIIALIASLLFCTQVVFAGQLQTIPEFHGLASNPNPDKIADGAHTVLDNMYIYQKDLQVVKGRTRLNSTAHADTMVNMFCYYESSGGTKKLIVKNSSAVVSYDTDGTNATNVATGLTNEKADCVQEGDTLYFTSLTDGLYKWTGSGSASAISGVSAPSAPSVSTTSSIGGMTSGLDAVVQPLPAVSSNYRKDTGTCLPINEQYNGMDLTGCNAVTCSTTNGGGASRCFDTSYFNKTCATTTTYSYEYTKSSSVWGIESSASTAGTITLSGNNTITVSPTSTTVTYNSNTCGTNIAGAVLDYTITSTGKQTATTQTLPSAPSAPFDGYCIYRTVANGTDYFKLGCVTGGGTTYTDGKPDSVLGNPLDLTVTPINPPKASFIETYKGILFLAQGNSLYFSHLPVANVTSADTYFISADKIQISADNSITGLRKTQNSLLIFTNKNVYELTGFGVRTFRLKSIIQGFGAVSTNTVRINNDGDVFMFAGTNGVYKVRTFSNPQDDINGTVVDVNRTSITHISEPDVRNIFQGIDSNIVLSPSDYTNATSYYDSDRGLYFLYIGQEAFIFDEGNKAWSHEPATKMVGAVWAKSVNATGFGYLIDNLGFFYKNFYGYTTSGVGGTVTGNPTSSTSTSLIDAGASFYTTNDGLKGVWVAKWNGTTGLEYRQISSNTATSLIVSPAWTVNPLTTDTYFIGYIVTNWTTKQYSFQPPPKLTQLQALSLVHNLSPSTQNLYIYLYQDKSSTYSSSNVSNPFDLSTHITMPKIGFTALSSWIQFQLLSFVYNTSDTVVSPVDIINYTFRIVPKEDE